MAVNLSPIWGAGAQLLDNSGNVLTGGKIYTYAAGTTTNQATFTSSSGLTANSNPIILNSAGRVPYEIWLLDGNAYKFVLKDSNDTLIGTWDNIVGINSNFINYTAEQEIQTATAGQTEFVLTTMQYQIGTNSLSVFVDGVNQYGPGAQYAYTETDESTVTFNSGLHLGAEVKFTTAQIQNAGVTDASQITYDPPFTDSVPTNVELKLAQTVSVKDFGAVGDGVTDDTAAIQNAIAAIANQNGGTLYVPSGEYRITSTLNINYPNIRIAGDGSVGFPYALVSSIPGTRFNWDGAAGDIVIDVATPTTIGSAKILGCQITNIEILGNGVAGTGIRILSHNDGLFENIKLTNFTNKAFETDCYVTNVDIQDEAGNQGNLLRNIIVDNSASGAGVCFWFGGSSNANTSYNKMESLRAYHADAVGYVFENADANICNQLRAFRTSGTLYDYEFYGPTAAGSVGGDGNVFIDIQAASVNGIILRGTTSGFTNGVKGNYFLIDNGNGTPIPTAEAGSVAVGSTQQGTVFGGSSSQYAMAEDVNDALAQRNLITTETLRISNRSGKHVELVDAFGNSWNINIDSGTGNLRLIRTAGTGSVLLPSYTLFNGAQIDFGAVNSGGAGYRVLRIPN